MKGMTARGDWVTKLWLCVGVFCLLPTAWAKPVSHQGNRASTSEAKARYADRDDAGDNADEPSITLDRLHRFVPRIRLGDVGSLRPVLLVRLATNVDHTFGDNAHTDSQLRLSKFRFGFKLDLLDERIAITARVNLEPGDLEFVDFYVDGVVTPDVRIRAGITKVPFTRYRMQSSSLVSTVGAAVAAKWFGGGRQLGVMVTDKWQGNFHYAAGIFTGDPTLAHYGVGLADLYGVDMQDALSLTDPSYKLRVHPELVGMVGYSTSDMGAPRSFDRQGGPWRFATAFSFSVDPRPNVQTDFTARIAPEFELRGHHMLIRGVFYTGWFAPPSGEKHWKVAGYGGIGEVTWAAHRWFELLAIWSGVWWTPAVAASTGAQVGSTQEAGGGFVIPVIGDQLKWTNDVRWTASGPKHLLVQGVVWRSQFQLSF